MAAHSTREQWLKHGADLLRPALARAGATVPDRVRFTLSLMRKRKTVGLCFDPSVSADGSTEILIRLDREDALEVLAILAHELIHAAIGLAAGHGSRFRRVALLVGLAGPMRATKAGPSFTALAGPLLLELGAFPHRALHASGDHPLERKQTARMLPLVCGACGLRIWTTRRALSTVADAGRSFVCPLDASPLESKGP